MSSTGLWIKSDPLQLLRVAKQPSTSSQGMEVLSGVIHTYGKSEEISKSFYFSLAIPCFFQGLWAVQAGGSDQQEEEG